MIPKIIHYCWFGGKPLPKMARKCIASWRKYCPDYEIKLWNESNFDINLYPYVKEAYEAKKFAFVSDVARLYALYHDGGIYLDTDVELVKSLNPFLHHRVFCGFEEMSHLATCVLGCEKGSLWAKDNLQVYENMHFLKEDGTYNITPNVMYVSAYMKEKGLILNGEYQDIENFSTVYPQDYFSPKNCATQEILMTPNTVAIHHFNMSWFSLHLQCRYKILRILRPYLPHSTAYFIAKVISRLIYWKR